MTVRSAFKALLKGVPHWWLLGEGTAVARTIAAIVDEERDNWAYTREARFPTRCGADDLLGLHEREREIPRGETETAAGFAVALTKWWQAHGFRGNAPTLLTRIGGMLEGRAAFCDPMGNRVDRTTDGTFTFTHGGTWDWDTMPAAAWGRFWLGVSGALGLSAQEDFGGAGDVTGTCGLRGITPAGFDRIRALFTGAGRLWKRAGTMPEWLVIGLDGEPIPASVTGYADWYQTNGSGVAVALRDPDFRYVSLYPEWNNTFAGVVAWPDTVTLVDGTTYDGANTWHADTTLPDGSTYAGATDTFPALVTLPDDGSPLE